MMYLSECRLIVDVKGSVQNVFGFVRRYLIRVCSRTAHENGHRNESRSI